ncbi:scavenger receptor cysteine-rich type 1 protein M160 [Sinocyclocheilus anshuiensis]|uniref:scavenger receptor cysteine-rich type 1 protein M160 n=1 Tax=Sinocyclocheilus anshuiensis TaxID=1608454 RepID=UPI0007B7D103|nr:PREDICTED: scavenger receptor cysteine-rich type 1 protein M160-like [Sinocyclocheilus anshuiensis]
MWFLLLYFQISAIQGLNVTLRGSDSPCKGRLEVYHGGNKQWGLVCHYGWIKENGEVVCKSIGCGNHMHSDVERTRYKDRLLPQQYWMDEVKCTSKEESLWNCLYVGINEKEKCDESSFVAVECSGKVTLSLNLNGQRDKCAGVVEFSTPNGIFGVCNNKWDESKANKICQELGCGDHHYIPKLGVFKGQQSEPNVLLNCVGNEQYSWQCKEQFDCQERASVICSNHTRFRLQDGSNVCSGLVEENTVKHNSWNPLQQTNVRPEVICTQLNCGSTGNFTNANGTNRLTCSDSVKLHNFTTECFGDVSIDVNGANYEVCYSDQSRENMGAVVCRELGCGDIVLVKKGSVTSNGLLSNVECQGDERSLWHCLANHEKKRCTGTKVICSGSLDVRLRDGLGHCSGRVEVKWEGSWRPIGYDRTTMNSDVVCQHLNCGTSIQINRELFVEGEKEPPEWLWNVRCRSSSAKLHECFDNTNLRIPYQNEKNTEIICKKEELKFFEGNSPCEGKVCIEQFDGKTDWLPAEPEEENKKKATDICKAMQCGSLVFFETEQNTTHAKVTCSGTPRVALQNPLGEKCWGMVKVCGDGTCGGVCSSTWRTNEDSKMICGNLGCGNPIQAQLPLQINNRPATYHSVYCSEKVRNMNMCNFIHNKNSTCKSLAQVICADSVKARLEDPRDRCAGKVSLFYAGKWTPICQDSLDTNLKNAICKELFCGKSINDEYDWISLEESKSTGLSRIKCLDSANSVSKCDLEGISEKECIVGYLKCTDWERLLLYNKEGECSGPVYGLRDGNTQQVSGLGWGREEGQKLCEYLQCGNYISHSTIIKNTKEWWKKTYNCSGKNNIWECESNDQPIQNQQQLNIQCDREEDEDDRKRDSSGTEYDDIEGQANGISPSQTYHDDDLNLPLLPKRPENILDQDTYEVEIEKQEDYDDVIPVEAAANENDEYDRKTGSSGTEYDDIEGQANGISPSQTYHDDDLNLPLLPKRPENILDQDTYEVEIEKQEDYDDVIPVEAAANENAGTTGTQAHVDVDVDEGADSDLDAGLVANADALLVTTEVEVHAQAE